MPIPGNMLSSVTEMVDPNTSGWTPLLNCTLGLGVGGRNGPGCLSVRSVAAGEVRARTVSSYPVTAGTIYQTFADAAGTVVERIGIRWLNAANVEISITWSLVTTTSSASFHRVGLAAAAPVGAARAQVVLSSTPAAGAVSQFWENVYLGPPIRTTGNLFGFGTESLEIDASGWVIELNGALTRQAPMVQWAVDNYLAGGEVLALTVTANGNAAARTVDRPAVTPGTEYLAYCYLNPPTSGSTTWIELRWYDATNTLISAQKSTLAAPGTGFYRQQASAVAPPTAATCGVAVGIDTATAAQVLRIEQAVVTVAPAIQAGTVVPYADGNFEQGVAGWTKTAGVATIARTTPWGAAFDGGYALGVSSSTATASTVRSALFPTPGGAGTAWRAQVAARVTAGTWASLLVRIRWYDAANVDLGTSTGVAYAFPTSSWYLLPADATAPATATQGAVELVATATAVSSVLQVDDAALWQALPLTAVAAVDVTASATLTLRELPLGYLVTIYRETQSGSRTLVRGPNGLYDRTPTTSDLLVVEDYEAPLLTWVRYYIEILSPDSTIPGTRHSAYIMIQHDDINVGWLKDPGNPQRNTTVMIQRAPDWQRPVEQASYVVSGRRNKVVLSGRRQGLEGDLSIWTRSDAERAALHWLLDSGNVLLWQAAPGMGVDDMYINVAQVTEGRTGGTAMELWRAWTLPLIEADMPVTTGVNGSAGRTWQDIAAEFATWAEVRATFATWEDVLLDRRG